MNQAISKAFFPSLEEALLHRQKKKMSKILKRAWDFDEALPFQICNDVEIVFSAGSSPPYDLQNFILFLANNRYEVGRIGWEKFASDLGSLYLRFVSEGKLKHLASKHLDQVCKLLEQVDTNLVPIARNKTPAEYAAYDSSGFDSDDDLPIVSLRTSDSSMNTSARSIESDSDDDLPIISLRTSFSSTNTTARSIDSDSDVDGYNVGFSDKKKRKKKGKKVPRKKKVDKKRKSKSLSSKKSKKSRKRKSRK